MHLRACATVLADAYPWLSNGIEKEVCAVLMPDEFESWKKTSALPADIFTFEQHVETLKEKNIIEEISGLLTLFAHTVARERLRSLREELKRAESAGDHDAVIEVLSKSKVMEGLLQREVVLEKP
jgi:hypothetical protein